MTPEPQKEPFSEFADTKNRDTARRFLAAAIRANPDCDRALVESAVKQMLEAVELCERVGAHCDALVRDANQVLADSKALVQEAIAVACRRN